ncbi:hypothetical protein MAUB1S_10781 [Mycolicibacterium aubagnense]
MAVERCSRRIFQDSHTLGSRSCGSIFYAFSSHSPLRLLTRKRFGKTWHQVRPTFPVSELSGTRSDTAASVTITFVLRLRRPGRTAAIEHRRSTTVSMTSPRPRSGAFRTVYAFRWKPARDTRTPVPHRSLAIDMTSRLNPSPKPATRDVIDNSPRHQPRLPATPISGGDGLVAAEPHLIAPGGANELGGFRLGREPAKGRALPGPSRR